MGYQESLLVCKTKNQFIRMCKVLNQAAADTSEDGLEHAGLEIYEIARLKKDMAVRFPPMGSLASAYPAGSYFVWWGGERGPQSDEWLGCYMVDKAKWAPCWDTVFAEYVPAQEMLFGINQGDRNTILENEWIRTFHPNSDGQINLDLIPDL